MLNRRKKWEILLLNMFIMVFHHINVIFRRKVLVIFTSTLRKNHVKLRRFYDKTLLSLFYDEITLIFFPRKILVKTM